MTIVTDETFLSLLNFFSLTVSDEEDLAEVGDENFHEKLFPSKKTFSDHEDSSEVGDENFHKRLFHHEKTHFFSAETALENIIFHMD